MTIGEACLVREFFLMTGYAFNKDYSNSVHEVALKKIQSFIDRHKNNLHDIVHRRVELSDSEIKKAMDIIVQLVDKEVIDEEGFRNALCAAFQKISKHSSASHGVSELVKFKSFPRCIFWIVAHFIDNLIHWNIIFQIN